MRNEPICMDPANPKYAPMYKELMELLASFAVRGFTEGEIIAFLHAATVDLEKYLGIDHIEELTEEQYKARIKNDN